MGPVRLSSKEVIAWFTAMRKDFLPWEFAVIRDMSAAYVAALRSGETQDAPPYGEVTFDRDVIGARASEGLRLLARKQ